MSEGLRMYTIYDRPSDYPDSFVLRGGTVTSVGYVPDPIPMAVAPTLGQVRESLPAGLCFTPPAHNDDPVILEVWF